MNLQICFVNDSGSDKDSDADDSKTETSLDTPLSPMVRSVDSHFPELKSERKNILHLKHAAKGLVLIMRRLPGDKDPKALALNQRRLLQLWFLYYHFQ